MKNIVRCIALVLVFSLLICVPVAADEPVLWGSFLDYDTGDSNDNYTSFTGTESLTYTLPFKCWVRYVEGLVQTSGRPITSAYLRRSNSSSSYPLTLLSLGNGLYRFYSSGLGYASNEWTLVFNNDGSAATYCSVVSFNYTEVRTNVFKDTGSFTVNWLDAYGYGQTVTRTMSSASSAAKYVLDTYVDPSDVSGIPTPLSFNATFSSSNWKKYDSITYNFRLNVHSLDSLVVLCGDRSLPYELSYVSASGVTENFHMLEPGVTSSDPTYYFNGDLVDREIDISVRVDLRDVLRTSSDVPYVKINGKLGQVDGEYVSLLSVVGLITYNSGDPFSYLLRSFRASVESWFGVLSDKFDTLINGDSEAAEEFGNEISTQATELEGISEELESVTKPDPGSISTSVDNIVSPYDVYSFTSIFRSILSNNVFLAVCTMSLTFALVSYTIYGKR